MKRIRRIPTILGLFLILIGIGVGLVAVRQGSTWFLRAEPETIPKQVKITNITDNSFTVSWITDGQTTGFVKYGSDKSLSFTASDDRDQISGKTGKYLTHHLTLKNLNPATSYSFKIGSGGKLFDNNGQPYQITTAPTIQTPPPSDVAYGTVVKADGSPASGAIVYLSLANTTPQSTITKTSGSWVIPLNLARSADLTSYTTYDRDASIEEIFVQAGQDGTATAVATTRYDSPLPTITLGQSFDFRKPQAEVAPEETPPAASKFTFEELATPSAEVEELTITNPDEGESVNTTKPAILGTAPAGKSLTITIESPTTQSGTVAVDEDGGWEWSPPEDLEPGEHTITASYTDEEGIVHSISRVFTVLAAGAGELPAIEATPSATVTPSPSPTPTATPTATPSGRVSVPSTEAGVPEVGYLTPTFLFLIIGVSLIGFGLFSNSLLKKKIF